MNTEHDETQEDETEDATTAVEELDAGGNYNLQVTIEESGPCRRHVKVVVPREDLDAEFNDVLANLGGEAEVPGFRVGHVPANLLKKRFKGEINNQIKRNILIGSLEQLSTDHNLDPINEPEIDVESLDIPDEGDFEYEFEVEVRPTFDLPEYSSITIEKPVREITDTDVDEYLDRFLNQYGSREDVDGPAESGNFVTVDAKFYHNDQELSHDEDLVIRLCPTLRFVDAELTGVDELFAGANVDDTREATLTISTEAETVELRGEEVTAKFKVVGLQAMKKQELNKEFLERLDMESVEELREEVHSNLKRQVEYDQRQSVREQVLEKVTDSGDWDLPEQLVMRQVENNLRRQILEMQQAGFTTQEIQARENELRQHALSSTRQGLKEHFVLDKIAVDNNLEPNETDVDTEITMMAMQRGENPRRVRARLEKSGMIENLQAQIRERMAVDYLLEQVTISEVDAPKPERADDSVHSVRFTVCGMTSTAVTADEEEETNDEDE